jgi:hypothetical protein
MKRIIYFLPLFATLFVMGCGTDETHSFADTQVQVESAKVSFTAAGGTGTIDLITPNVQATSNESWCQISISDNKVIVTAMPNESLTARSAMITLRSGDKTNYIPITQNGVIFKITNLPDEVEGVGVQKEYEYICDFPVTLKSKDADWLTLTTTGEDQLNLTINQNPSVTQGRVVNLVFQTVNGLEFPWIIRQSASIFSFDKDIKLGIKGSKTTVPYESDFPVSLQGIESNWLTCEVTATTLIFTAQQNYSNLRATTVTLKVGENIYPLIISQAGIPLELPLGYDDFIGYYTITYGTTYNASTSTPYTLDVQIVSGEAGKTYYLKGLLKDESIGNIVLTYDDIMGFTYAPRKIGTDTSIDRDVWQGGQYGNRNTNSTAAAYGCKTDEIDLSNDGLTFKLAHWKGTNETDISIGIYLRSMPVGGTTGSAAYTGGVNSPNGQYYYITFTKK